MIIGGVIGFIFCLLWMYGRQTCLYPDSSSYLLMSGGVTPSSPYRWRVFIPWIVSFWNRKRGAPPYLPTCGDPILAWSDRRAMMVWLSISMLSMSACSGLVYLLAERIGAQGWIASVMFCSLPWYRMLAFGPFMSDQLAMLCSLSCAFLPIEIAIPVSIFAGFVHERSPVFAALFAWNPLLLVGLAGPAYIALFGKKGTVQPYEAGWVDNPLSAIFYHRNNKPHHYIAGWGLCLLGITTSPQVLLSLAICYGQLIISRDRARIYQWCAPLIVPTAALVVSQWPQHFVIPALAIHLCAPFMASGVRSTAEECREFAEKVREQMLTKEGVK